MPISCPRMLTKLLRAGDVLVRSPEGWRLVGADREVEDEAVRQIRIAPRDDQLPGFPPDLAQTWHLIGDQKRLRIQIAKL